MTELKKQYLFIKDNLDNLSKDEEYLSFIKSNPFLSHKTTFDQVYNLSNIAIIQYPNILKFKSQIKKMAQDLKIDLNHLKINKENWVKDIYSDDSKKINDIEDKILDLFRLIPDNLKKEQINIVFKTIPLSYSINNEVFINIDQKDDLIVSEIAHELGHILERQNPEIKQKCFDFVKSRSNKLIQLGDISDHSSNYQDPSLLVYDGRFFDPYVGKIYNDNQTEVLSMGLQMLILNPELFLFRDCEHFKFVANILGENL